MTLPAREQPPADLVAASPEMHRALELIAGYATFQYPILILGPTGAGKEVLARYAHDMSGRRGPFVPVNCGALPREMVEALLFGSRRGAYTSSIADRVGFFEQAAGGTLYLDELGSLPLESQPKLLRAVEDKCIQRLGDEKPTRTDVRIVASLQDDPMRLIDSRLLRHDLYYRLAVGIVALPALVERPADIGALASLFTTHLGKRLSLSALHALKSYDWPGNVRELQAVVSRAVAVCRGSVLTQADISEALSIGRMHASQDLAESRRLLAACLLHDWDVELIGRELSMSRATVYRKLRRYGLSPRTTGSIGTGAEDGGGDDPVGA